MIDNISALLLATVSTAGFIQEIPRVEAVPGGLALVPLNHTDQVKPQAYFKNKRVLVVRHANKWNALVGLPLSLAAGSYRITYADNSGAEQRIEFTVRPKEYAVQRITIKQKRFVNPTAEDLKRFERDRRAIHTAFNTWSDEPVVSLRFRLPARGRLSGPFGLKRFFNDQPRQPHSGIDIAATRGTTVVAPAPGRVLGNADYFFNGQTVFLDHGQGLVSMFNHLDKFLVTPGERVAPGQPIGEIGMTGRATGPHLHWSVSLNDSRVDPLLFVADDALTRTTDDHSR
jgi:murein DD-endopeptidase MepM/ murein hydrolase activator NlpD